MDLSFVLPCLNEAETLERCLVKARSSLERWGISGEIIVADNGSTDGSIQIAERLGARVIPVHAKGYGNALRGGIEAAQGQWIIMGDSDDSYDFSDIGLFLEKLRQGDELVMGCRMPSGQGKIMPGAMPWKHRWIGNPILSFIGRLFFHCPIHDFHCGLRAFSKEAYQEMELQTTGMEFASEMVIQATLRKMRISQVPITLYKDGRSRPPHLRSWRDGWRHLRFMLLFSPRWLFVWPGAICFMIGAIVFSILSFGSVRICGIRFDTNTLLASSALMMIGFQTTFFGVFSRLFCESIGLLPPHPTLQRLFRRFSLEKGIVGGIVLLGIGFFLFIQAFWLWKEQGFAEQSYSESLHRMIPSITFLTLGVQGIFSSFFLGVLGLQRRRS